MFIQQIHAKNLKGRSFDHELAPCTIISGPNFAGKTAISDAIRLALLGKLPECGGKPGDAFLLSSASTMSAEVVLSDGTRIARALTQRGASVSCEPAKIDTTYAGPLLEPAAWFGMTERERIDYVFSHVAMPPETTRSGIVAQLQRISFSDVHSEEIETSKAATIATINDILIRSQGPGATGPISEAIVRAEAELADDFTLWNGRAKAAEGAIQVLTELKLRENECTAATLTDLRNEVSRLEGLCEEASRTVGSFAARMAAAQQAAKRRRQIEQDLTAPAPVERPLPVSTAHDVESYREALAHGKESIIKMGAAPDMVALRAAYEVAEKAYHAAVNAQSVAIGKVKELDARSTELASHDSCPFCKSKAKGWQARVAKEIAAEAESAAAELVTTDTAVAQTDVAFKEAFAAVKRAESWLEGKRTVENDIRNCESFIQRHESEAAAHAQRVESVKAQNASDAANHRNRVTALNEELGRMEDAMTPTDGETQAVVAELAKYKIALNDSRVALKRGEALAQDILRAAQAATEATKAAARRDVIKRMKAELTELKSGLVAVAFGSLLETANKVVGDVLPTPLAYHEESAQVGRWSKAGFVSHRAFSGTEQLLTYIAIATALSSASRLKVAIIDELARLTPRVQQQVIENLGACVINGVLDQVILIIPTDSPLPDRIGWSAVNVEAAA